MQIGNKDKYLVWRKILQIQEVKFWRKKIYIYFICSIKECSRIDIQCEYNLNNRGKYER